MLKRYIKKWHSKLEKKLLISIRKVIREELQNMDQSEYIRGAIKSVIEEERAATHSIIREELVSERKAQHWIVRKELVSERRPIHWIVRNELQKSMHNLEFQELAEASRDSLVYARQHFDNVRAFNDKFTLREYLLQTYKPEGIVLEFGVFEGSSITQIAELLPENRVYGFDTFEGLPEDWRPGFYREHFKVTSVPEVPYNVELIKGLFEDTLPIFLEKHNEPIGMLHIDCDLYTSTSAVLNLLKTRLKKGVILLFDEYYNYPGWRAGEFAAFQEFINASDLNYEYIAYNSYQCQVAVKLL